MPRVSQLLITLSLLAPASLAAQSVTVLQNSWVALSKEEIAALGFDAKLAVGPAGDDEARLTVTLPDKIEGRQFIDAQARLLNDDLLIKSIDAETEPNDAEGHVIRFKLNLVIVSRVKLRLRYTGGAKYEATIKLDGYQTII